MRYLCALFFYTKQTMSTNYTEQAQAAGHIKIEEDRILYVHQNKKRNFNNPEEKVQAEAYAKLIIEYGYKPQQIKLFLTVKMGVSEKEADIVVFKDMECTEPYIVVECKKEDISEMEFQEAVKQAFSYAHALAGTTKYVWVTKGNKEEFYSFDKDKDVKKTEPNIPYAGEDGVKKYRFAKGGFYKDKEQGKEKKVNALELGAVTEAKLTQIFKQAHDALWGGGELNPAQAFDELDKLVFCKIWDEKHTRKGEAYQFQIINESPEELKTRILAIYDKGKLQDKEVFNKPIDLSAERIKIIVEYFQSISFSETDLDAKGKAFETFLGAYFRGNFGQFFTPRNVIQFVVDVLPISNESKVLDTSCGSGGFLLYALDKVRRKATEIYPDHENDVQDHKDWFPYWHDFAQNNLFGIEINDSISRVAKMNMIIHDDGHTNVVCHDGLFSPEVIAEKTGNKGFIAASFDYIITNPPFGSIAKQSEKAYMKTSEGTAPTYDFALKNVNWIDKALKSEHALTGRENQSTEILFIEQCHKFLKPAGFLAIVIPDGILTNSSLQYVRDAIEDKFRIVAVVSLPQTAFTHTGAGVKSSVLFLRKYSGETTQKIQDEIAKIQSQMAKQHNLKAVIEGYEQEKKEKLKPIKAPKGQKLTEEQEAQRKLITEEYNEKIGIFKEKLEDSYQHAKQTQLPDYPIFMALAENIGYDATGKTIAQNDLQLIGTELKRFIEAVQKGNDSFFA